MDVYNAEIFNMQPLLSDNVMPDDTKDYQTKSYREKVKLGAVPCPAVADRDRCLPWPGRFAVLQGKPVQAQRSPRAQEAAQAWPWGVFGVPCGRKEK